MSSSANLSDFNFTHINITVNANEANIEDLQIGLNVFFVLCSGYLVFLMQTGFAMLTAGSVRSKNTKNVLIKNVLDACVGALAYYIFGFSFAYGPVKNKFIASGTFALAGFARTPEVSAEDADHDLTSFFFQWAFAATAATIVSGSVAERTSFYAYLAYAFFLTGFIYPVVSHWIWDGGFLGTLYGEDGGTIDFAGCTVVHMVGGFAGLVGAAVVGPRLGRFDDEGRVVPIPGHSATLATLGTFLLWFGWYGFNPGSALGLTGGGWAVAERCAVTTTLSAATSGVVTLVIIKIRDHIFDLIAVLNGILAGLVGITACCAFVEPYAAVVIGVISSLVYISFAMLLLKLKIDDPLEAFPIHGGCGIWGALAAGLFNRQEYQVTAGFSSVYYGGFYGGGGRLFGANLLAVVVVIGWTCALITPLFVLLKVLGLLRISPEEELVGNDVSKHGGTAYPIDAIGATEKDAVKSIDHLGMDNSLKDTTPHEDV